MLVECQPCGQLLILAIDTSVDLTRAITSLPTFRSRSWIERDVITEVTMPCWVSTSTSETTGPKMISSILPRN